MGSDDEITEEKFRKIMLQEVKIIKESVVKTESKIESIAKDIEGLKNENEILKNENLKLNVGDLAYQNSVMFKRLNELEQYTRRENVIISGIPAEKGENVRQIVKNVAAKLDVEMDDQDISTCHRLSNKKTPNIVARLNNRDKKAEMIKQSKIKQLKAKTLGWQMDHQIFVRNHLTKYTSDLLFEAKRLRDEGCYKFAWENNTNVYIREDESSQAIKIEHHSQLDMFQQQTEDEIPEDATATNGSGNETEQPKDIQSSSGVENNGFRQKQQSRQWNDLFQKASPRQTRSKSRGKDNTPAKRSTKNGGKNNKNMFYR